MSHVPNIDSLCQGTRVFVPAFALVLLIGVSSSRAVERPNILFVVADDHGPWAMSCAGHPEAKTPNMDRLAREGVRLTNCFTPTPVCSPSRASILCSRYGSEVHITDWINPKTEPSVGLDPQTAAWPKLLSAAGYRTGLIGKWHLGTEDRFHPSVFGYQYFMGFRAGGNSPRDPMLERNGKAENESGFIVDLLGEDAVEFLRRDAGKPFALSLHFREPHAPYLPTPESEWSVFQNLDSRVPNPDFPLLDAQRVKKLTREYLSSVAAVDRNLGRVLDELDRLKLADNTLVIYTSDHGYNIGHHGVLHKGNGHWILTQNPPATENIPSGQRPNLFDTSLRVPALVRWPGKIKATSVVSDTVTHLDWFPTLLAAAGVSRPDGIRLRGRNALPVLQGSTPSDWSNDLYAEYSIHNSSRTHMRCVRTADWKLMRDFLNPGRDELYDLKNDPDETTNLIASDRRDAKAAVATLSERLVTTMRDIGDPLTAKVK